MAGRKDEVAARIAEGHADALAAVERSGRIHWCNRQFRRRFPGLEPGHRLAALVPLQTEALQQVLDQAFVSELPLSVRLGKGTAPGLWGRVDCWRLPEGEPPLVLFRLADGGVQGGFSAALPGDRLLAEISHDVRTPLNAIIGFSEAMASGIWGELHPRYRAYVEDIRASGHLLLDFADRILRLYEDRPAQEGAADLARCLAHCLQAVRPLAAEKSLSLLVPERQVLPRLLVEQGAVDSILLNLIENAVKFSHRGGRVTVTVDRSLDEGLELLVEDEGPGIPGDELQHVVEPFYRVKHPEVTGPHGYGLGLPTVKRLVDSLGGDLRLDSSLGHGTSALVRLPPTLVEWQRAN